MPSIRRNTGLFRFVRVYDCFLFDALKTPKKRLKSNRLFFTYFSCIYNLYVFFLRNTKNLSMKDFRKVIEAENEELGHYMNRVLNELDLSLDYRRIERALLWASENGYYVCISDNLINVKKLKDNG